MVGFRMMFECSCTLQSMADSFGVSTDFINRELAQFISEGQIHAKIDRVCFVLCVLLLDE